MQKSNDKSGTQYSSSSNFYNPGAVDQFSDAGSNYGGNGLNQRQSDEKAFRNSNALNDDYGDEEDDDVKQTKGNRVNVRRDTYDQ